MRWLAWERAKVQRMATEAVNRHGLANVSSDIRREYNDLMLRLRNG